MWPTNLKRWIHPKSIGLVCFLVILASFYRDWQFIEAFPADLRNRIVGARLQWDGKLPYDYIWKYGEPLRYFDFAEQKVITATPFSHTLYGALAWMPYYWIAAIHLILQYVTVLALVGFMRIRLGRQAMWLAMVVVALFLQTEVWQTTALFGQMYIFLAGLLGAIVFLVSGKTTSLRLMAAGVLCAALVLIRPSHMLFLPIAAVCVPRKWFIGGALMGFLMFALVVLASPFQRQLWQQYRHMVQEHSANHILHPVKLTSTRPAWDTLEGYQLNNLEKARSKVVTGKIENASNLYYYLQRFTQQPFSVAFFNGVTALLVFVGSAGLFWCRRRLTGIQITVAILGLMAFVDYLMPVYRGSYVGAVWLPVLLLIAYGTTSPFLWLLIFLSFVLKMMEVAILPLQALSGELLWMLATAWFVWQNRHLRHNLTSGSVLNFS